MCSAATLAVVVLIVALIAVYARAMSRWRLRHNAGSSNTDWPTIGALGFPLLALGLVLLVGAAYGPLYNWPGIGWIFACR